MSFVWKFAMWLPTPFLRGFVLAHFWAWFIVPTFHVAPISAAVAYGIAGLAYIAVSTPDLADAEKDWDAQKWFVRIFTTGYVLPVMSLVMGWAVQRFWL